MISVQDHPIRSDWAELEDSFLRAVRNTGRDHRDVRFSRGRLAEGRRVGRFLAHRFPGENLEVLDIGAGNGGVALGVGNYLGYDVTALDVDFNWVSLSLRSLAGSSVRFLVAEGQRLPFETSSFNVVLCLETFEHIERPALLGAEIMRVLRPGGTAMITTPARINYLFRRDPHFGIPGLLLLPDSLQRWVATSLLNRVSPADYDVHHIFWYAGSIARFFPGHSSIQAIDSGPFPSKNSFWNRFTWKRLMIWKARASDA